MRLRHLCAHHCKKAPLLSQFSVVAGKNFEAKISIIEASVIVGRGPLKFGNIYAGSCGTGNALVVKIVNDAK